MRGTKFWKWMEKKEYAKDKRLYRIYGDGSIEWIDPTPQMLLGFKWEYLWNHIDMNTITENWNFNYDSIGMLLDMEIEKLEEGAK